MTDSDWVELGTAHPAVEARTPILYARVKDLQLDANYFKTMDEVVYLGEFQDAILKSAIPPTFLTAKLDAQTVFSFMKKKHLLAFAKKHRIQVSKTTRIAALKDLIASHRCDDFKCNMVSVFRKKGSESDPKDTTFPPPPASDALREKILHDIGTAFQPASFEEEGCMVCGELKLRAELTIPDLNTLNLDLLVNPCATVQERKSHRKPIERIDGPILAPGCEKICPPCASALRKDTIPKTALRNGLWVGEVPPQLQNLTFAEQQLIAKVRHNRCVMRVMASKRGKMMANAVMFSNPILKVYNKLPPAKDELSEILAFVWIGADLPKATDISRTPMLVRKTKVRSALEWLRSNNPIYHELEISEENLATYDLADVPVTCDWRRTEEEDETGLESGIQSVHGQEADGEGTDTGPCTFRVHGLTSDRYENLSEEELKLKALNHMHLGYDVLGIGHEEHPQSMYDNPAAYPAMFPWLFPYGLGGFGNPLLPPRFSESEHKRHLLMYYDKRFQTDFYFPLIAFNHMQVKGGVTGSFLLAKKDRFAAVAERLLSVNRLVLKDVVDRMGKGEKINLYSAKTDEERKCFKILEDLDLVGGHVKGSVTTKKYMRNEIWSLTMHLGAPSWFITLSPADVKHPLCLYYAGQAVDFSPDLLSSNERNHLISMNPVAAARFFDYMVQVFIKDILRVNRDESGLYGNTSAYYGTVEQQGRLTLHLHALIWIQGAPSPAEIRERLTGEHGVEFGTRLTQYLDACHRAYFSTGTLDEVKSRIPKNERVGRRGFHDLDLGDFDDDNISTTYCDPTQTLPSSPPASCNTEGCDGCDTCARRAMWFKQFDQIVDDLIFRSNIHTHHSARPIKSKKQGVTKGALFSGGGCLNSEGVCKARFPRDLVPETVVDYTDGSVKSKHIEPMLNCVTDLLTWATRSNTDVSSLLSGTALQAAISYIADYITKPGLKTYHVLNILNDLLYSKLETALGADSEGRLENARKLIVQITNALTAKLEIGSPMASMYLLGNPDHYTSHEFVLFWWRQYVTRVLKDWGQADSEDDSDRVVVTKGQSEDEWVAYDRTDDYVFRPRAFEDMPLIEWIRCSTKRKAEIKKGQTTEEIGGGWWRLHPSHPQYKTHVVRFSPTSRQKHVLNYVGGVLPRRDQGNREYYCCTMLAFFKPWRSGSDLKTDVETWDDAFTGHTFDDWMLDRMKNYNLKYECYDARDDYYHIQLSKTKAVARARREANPLLATEEDEWANEPDWVSGPLEDYVDEGDQIGPRESNRIMRMKEAEMAMRMAGWLNPSDTKESVSRAPFLPDIKLTPTQWKATVSEAREAVVK